MPDRYDSMKTADLEREAAERGVDLSGARTNPERAERLRIADRQATGQDQAAADQARQADEEAARQAADRQGDAGRAPQEGTQPAQDTTQRRPGEPAPYVDEQDLRNRTDAAAGTTEYARQPEGDVPPVGGQADDGTDTREGTSQEQRQDQ